MHAVTNPFALIVFLFIKKFLNNCEISLNLLGLFTVEIGSSTRPRPQIVKQSFNTVFMHCLQQPDVPLINNQLIMYVMYHCAILKLYFKIITVLKAYFN